MKNLFQQKQSGYSLVGLMVAVAITGVVALGAAYVMVSSQNTANISALQSEIDRLQYLNLQLSRNPSFILKQPGFEKTGLLYQCLQHSPPNGSNCTQVSAPPTYVSPRSEHASGFQKNISSTIQFSPHCDSALSCDAINIKTTTSLAASSQSTSSLLTKTPQFQTRSANTVIPSYTLAPRVGFNFNCVRKTGLITGLNYDNSQAQCTPLSGTLSTTTSPLKTFGPLVPTTTQTMTNTDCGSNGFSAIGNFQNQVNCMTLASAPPPPGPPPPPSPPPGPPPAPSAVPDPPSCQGFTLDFGIFGPSNFEGYGNSSTSAGATSYHAKWLGSSLGMWGTTLTGNVVAAGVVYYGNWLSKIAPGASPYEVQVNACNGNGCSAWVTCPVTTNCVCNTCGIAPTRVCPFLADLAGCPYPGGTPPPNCGPVPGGWVCAGSPPISYRCK